MGETITTSPGDLGGAGPAGRSGGRRGPAPSADPAPEAGGTPDDRVPAGVGLQSTGDIFPLVYDTLKALSRRWMAHERPDHTLQPTALVHEAYVRLAGEGKARWASKGQFFQAAAEAMRRILIEHARRRGRVKRGGECRRLPVNVLDLADDADPEQILALDDAIRRFGEEWPDAAAIVRLRFFTGLSVSETAEALGVSPRTVDRGWAYARAWIFQELSPDDG